MLPVTFTSIHQMKSIDNCRNRPALFRNEKIYPSRVSLILLFCALLLLAGCTLRPIEADGDSSAATEEQKAYPPGIEPLADGAADGAADVEGQETDAATPAEGDAPESATVTVQRRNVNIRSGPGLDFQVVAGAVEGDSFITTGKTENGWWRICCIVGPGDAPGELTQTAWISQWVVTPTETAVGLPALVPLFPEDLTASWNVEYECGSRRCAVTECAAVARTEIHNIRDLRWLEINRTVTWEDACGADSTWPHQLDRIEGTERYPNNTGLFLFNYWVGALPGDTNVRFRLDSGEEIDAWCSDVQKAEVVEESGWTTIYKGLTCHDIRTGMLVSMQYTKYWLFTGEFEGDRYERAYFRDYEIYRVKLDSTNAVLAIINAGHAE